MALMTLIFSMSLITNATAQVRPKMLTVKYAINLNWCGRVKKTCQEGQEALRVAACETGNTFDIWAKNGQYLGLFQMGSSERRIFGHGWNAWVQAKAAHRYYVRSGRDWSPWSCRWAA
jgi:hypothetical protein